MGLLKDVIPSGLYAVKAAVPSASSTVRRNPDLAPHALRTAAYLCRRLAEHIALGARLQVLADVQSPERCDVNSHSSSIRASLDHRLLLAHMHLLGERLGMALGS